MGEEKESEEIKRVLPVVPVLDTVRDGDQDLIEAITRTSTCVDNLAVEAVTRTNTYVAGDQDLIEAVTRTSTYIDKSAVEAATRTNTYVDKSAVEAVTRTSTFAGYASSLLIHMLSTVRDGDQDLIDGVIGTSTQVDRAAEHTDSNDVELTTIRLIFILFGLWIGILLCALNQIMVATIVGPISTAFDSFTSLSWIATTYLIGLSVTQPLSGHFSDLCGRRVGLVIALSVFAVGTLLCGLAPKFWVLLLGRGIQGLGGGAVNPITTYIENDIVPIRSRGLIEGMGNVMYGITLALGGIYGGSVQKAIGWKWTFLIQVPIIVLDIVLVLFVLHIPRAKNSRPSRRQIDFVGMISLISSLFLFQFGMNTGGTTFSWLSAPVITCLVAAFGILIFFVSWEVLKAHDPLIPIRAMIQRSVASSQLSSFFFSLGNTSILYYVPVYLQVIGYSTSASGFRFIPMALCFALGSFLAGYLAKVTARYYYINLPVQALSVLGAILLCTLKQFTPPWAPFVYLGLYGAGSGGGYVTRLMGLITSVDSKRLGLVQAATFTISNSGTTLGITIATMIFQHLSVAKLQALFKDQPGKLQQITGNFEAISSLDSVEKQSVISTYLQATRGVFYMAMASLALASMASFCMQNNLLTDEIDPQDSEEAGQGREGKLPLWRQTTLMSRISTYQDNC